MDHVGCHVDFLAEGAQTAFVVELMVAGLVVNFREGQHYYFIGWVIDDKGNPWDRF